MWAMDISHYHENQVSIRFPKTRARSANTPLPHTTYHALLPTHIYALAFCVCD